jgi:hypothetical protein
VLSHRVLVEGLHAVACSLLARDVRLDDLRMSKGPCHAAGNHVGGVLNFLLAEELHQPPTLRHTVAPVNNEPANY